MQPSYHLIVMGVGVLMVFGPMPAGIAKPVSTQAPSSSTTDESTPFPLQEAAASLATRPGLPQTAKTQAVTPARSSLATQLAIARVFTGALPAKSALPAKGARPAKAGVPMAPMAVAKKVDASEATIAQSTPSTTTRPAATPDLAPAPPGTTTPASSGTTTPAPSGPTKPQLSTPDPGPSRPLGPAKAGTAPEYLNPDPNPLSFPTKPEEVKLRGIQPITLQQAIELAQRNNRSLQVTRLQLERSRAALRQSQAALYPTLSVQSTISRSLSASGNRNQNNALSALLGGSNNDNSISNAFSASATLSYDIFTSGQRPANIRAAEKQLRSDQLQVEINEEQLRLDVAGDYYNLQQNDEAVRIQQSSVRNNEASLRDTQALENAGLGTRFDVLQSQVQLANSQQNLTNALAQQQISRRQLAQRLSLSPAIDLAAADPVDVAGGWNLSLEETIVLALKNRAELEQQLVQREQAQQQRRAALAGLGPKVTAQAQYSLSDILDDSSPVGDGYAFQFGVSWSLFDGGSSIAQARQAEANVAIAEQNFADQSNQVRFAVEQGYANLLSNFENIGTTTQALGQAREALRLAQLRFNAGVGTSTDVINAENALTNAEGNRVNAIIGYNRSLATLQRAVTHLPIPTGATSPVLVSPGGSTTPSTSTPGTTAPAPATPSTTTPSSAPSGNTTP